MKKLLMLLLTLILTLSFTVALSSCLGGGDGDGDNGGNTNDQGAGGGNTCQHRDADDDGSCDLCGTPHSDGNEPGTGGGNTCQHRDADDDGSCDLCGTPHNDGNEPDEPGSGDEPDAGDEDEADYFNENGELILYKDGVPTFCFVMGSGIGSVGSDIGDLVETLNDLSEEEVKQVTTAEAPVPVEILIGIVNNRGEEYKINKYDLGMQGYMVKQIGTKIVVLGGSDTALSTAVNYLKTTVFGIKKSNDPFTDLTMTEAMNKEYVQSGYDVSSVTIAGNPIGDYTVFFRNSDANSKALGNAFRDRLYSEVGIHLDTKNKNEPEDGSLAIIFRTVRNDGVSDGFAFFVDEVGNLIIECQYPEKYVDKATEFLDSYIFNCKGDVAIPENLSRTVDIRNIYYSEFGADVTGATNAFEAIYEAHAYANTHGHIVNADRDATYRILSTGGNVATIRTQTNWGNAKFIIDDSWIVPGDRSEWGKHIFQILPDTDTENSYYPDPSANDGTIQKLLADINAAGGLKADDFKNFDLGLNRRAMVRIVNSNHQNYIRYGDNAGSSNQNEIVVIDENGVIDPLTYLLFDYAEVTHIIVTYIDDAPITLSGGEITTIANCMPRDYAYYTKRGIDVKRSNLTIDGIVHHITGEGDTGAPYAGFLSISQCSDVRVENCTFTAHKAYKYLDSSTNTMGTYDISPSNANNVYFLNCDMTNFFITDNNGNTVTSVGNGYWGVMGGNFIKNITYDTCELTRFDAHCGTYNATIKDSKVADITIIGGGTFTMTNTEVYMSSASKNYLVVLRADYGATWKGDFIIEDSSIMLADTYSGDTVCVFQGSWNEMQYASHDFGYDCYSPTTVTIKNLKAKHINGKDANSVTKVQLATGGITSAGIGTSSINKRFHTEKFIIISDTEGYSYTNNFPDGTVETKY